jgi:hypothetical protein
MATFDKKIIAYNTITAAITAVGAMFLTLFSNKVLKPW